MTDDTRWLVLFDTDRIKDYILSTPDLGKIRGASILLEFLNGAGSNDIQSVPLADSTRTLLTRHAGSEELVVTAGGMAAGVLRASADPNRVVAEVERLYVTQTRIASVTGIPIKTTQPELDGIPEGAYERLMAKATARGLHPYVGHLHLVRDRHPALASDLLEEFRAPIVDSLVLYVINSKLLTAADFYRPSTDPEGACLLRDPARKTFLKHFEQKMGTPLVHPHTGEAVDWRRAMDLQVAEMVQWIRGEVSEYRPMEIR